MSLQSKKSVEERIGERRMGNPRTDAERRKRHLAKFGTTKLPPRGTGLKK